MLGWKVKATLSLPHRETYSDYLAAEQGASAVTSSSTV
jgi:hypothetical protein